MSSPRWCRPHRVAAPLLSTDDLRGVRALAASLPAPGRGEPRLKGRHVAVIGRDPPSASAAALADAATALGATVVHLGPPVFDQGVHAAAELLGRLYDLIACDGLDAPTTSSVGGLARVPVLDCDELLALIESDAAAPVASVAAGLERDRVLRALLIRLLG